MQTTASKQTAYIAQTARRASAALTAGEPRETLSAVGRGNGRPAGENAPQSPLDRLAGILANGRNRANGTGTARGERHRASVSSTPQTTQRTQNRACVSIAQYAVRIM